MGSKLTFIINISRYIDLTYHDFSTWYIMISHDHMMCLPSKIVKILLVYHEKSYWEVILISQVDFSWYITLRFQYDFLWDLIMRSKIEMYIWLTMRSHLEISSWLREFINLTFCEKIPWFIMKSQRLWLIMRSQVTFMPWVNLILRYIYKECVSLKILIYTFILFFSPYKKGEISKDGES